MISVRNISILIFLLFYVSSATSVAQRRARRMARRIVYSVIHVSQVHVDESAKPLEDTRTRYREAKRVAFDFDLQRAPVVDVTPRVVIRSFLDFLLLWETHQFVTAPGTRAPPFQA